MASLVVVLIILGCAAYQYFKGTFAKSFATIIVVICAGTVAFWIRLRSVVPLGRPGRGWTRPMLVLAISSAMAWAVARQLAAGGAASATAAVTGVLLLLLVFAAGVRLVPGCLDAGDLDVARSLIARLRQKRSVSGEASAGRAEDA